MKSHIGSEALYNEPFETYARPCAVTLARAPGTHGSDDQSDCVGGDRTLG